MTDQALARRVNEWGIRIGAFAGNVGGNPNRLCVIGTKLAWSIITLPDERAVWRGVVAEMEGRGYVWTLVGAWYDAEGPHPVIARWGRENGDFPDVEAKHPIPHIALCLAAMEAVP